MAKNRYLDSSAIIQNVISGAAGGVVAATLTYGFMGPSHQDDIDLSLPSKPSKAATAGSSDEGGPKSFNEFVKPADLDTSKPKVFDEEKRKQRKIEAASKKYAEQFKTGPIYGDLTELIGIYAADKDYASAIPKKLPVKFHVKEGKVSDIQFMADLNQDIQESLLETWVGTAVEVPEDTEIDITYNLSR